MIINVVVVVIVTWARLSVQTPSQARSATMLETVYATGDENINSE